VLFCSVISWVYEQGVELNDSKICKNVFASLLEMRKVYDLVGHPS